MKRHLAFVLAALLGAAAPAGAVTIRDLIELTKAGLGEEVLLALVEVDGGVFPVDAETLRSLKQAGVPERVIAAVVRSGRTPPPAPEPLPVADPAAQAPDATLYAEPYPPLPEVVYVPTPSETVIREVAVPYYVAVPVSPSGSYGHGHPGRRVEPSIAPASSLQGPHVYQTDRPAPAHPTYWGNGGRLRPDAWQPASSGGGGRKDSSQEHGAAGRRDSGRGDNVQGRDSDSGRKHPDR